MVEYSKEQERGDNVPISCSWLNPFSPFIQKTSAGKECRDVTDYLKPQLQVLQRESSQTSQDLGRKGIAATTGLSRLGIGKLKPTPNQGITIVQN